MAHTKFGAGQRVSVTRAGTFAAPSGVYTIVRALPQEGGPRQYQVRGDSESFDRIMDEARLEAISYE